MNESVQENLTAVAPEVPETRPAICVGKVLRQAREGRQMSVDDVAQLLKISYRQVEALESDDWTALPGQTFVRGFVRNYARLLHLEAEPLLQQIKAEQAPEDPNIVLPQASTATLPEPGQGKRRELVAMAAAVLMVGAAVVAYVLVPADFWQSGAKADVAEAQAGNEEKKQEQAAEPAFPPAAGNEAASTDAEPVAPPAAEPVAAAPAPAPVATAAPASVAPAAPASAPIASEASRFKFRFEQPSWVEVKDKSGRIVFSQLSQAGTERDIEGTPPFSVVVGNASHVKLTYKGRDVPLEPRSKEDVARITLD